MTVVYDDENSGLPEIEMTTNFPQKIEKTTILSKRLAR